MPNSYQFVFAFLLIVSCCGCDDEERQLRDWSRENSAAAQALVEADAVSRTQFAALQQSVQLERQTLADGFAALEADRREVAAARERVPLLATALQGLAGLVLGGAALWVCVRLLTNFPDDQGAAELEETLILTLAGESDLLSESATAPASRTKTSLPSPSPTTEPVLTHEEG